jgi:hypothetical protein
VKRLLVVGKKLPRLTCIDLDEWRSHPLLDYQGILFDCREQWHIPDYDALANLLSIFLSNGHTVFVILPEAKLLSKASQKDIDFIPRLTLSFGFERGQTLRVASTLPLFHEYFQALQGHELFIKPMVGPGNWTWQNSITDNVNRPICGQFHGVFVFHPPARGREKIALDAIFKFFQPDFDEPDPQPTPEWGKEVISKIPGVEETEGAIEKIEQEIDDLEEKRTAEMKKKEELERWAGLLWFDGIPLQDLVREGFDFLGFDTESEDPTGHTHDFVARHSGQTLLVEVTGSQGPISLDKGRQLLQWIADSADPVKSKGILVGNAFRSEPPGKRPPTSNHKIFVTQLVELAEKRNLALVDTRELFRIITAKLSGVPVQAEVVAKDLASDGEIKFSHL